jgi:hypothetical protein
MVWSVVTIGAFNSRSRPKMAAVYPAENPELVPDGDMSTLLVFMKSAAR